MQRLAQAQPGCPDGRAGTITAFPESGFLFLATAATVAAAMDDASFFEHRVRDVDEAAAWAARCLARMLQLDPAADPALLMPIVEDMSQARRWADKTPEEAAEWCFGPLTGTCDETAAKTSRAMNPD